MKISENTGRIKIPNFRQSELNSETRRAAILDELFRSQAETLILLGDLPIKWFLNYFTERKYEGLAAFGSTHDSYGLPHEIKLAGKPFQVIPLCHPRQAQRLGASSKIWFDLHQHWIRKRPH